MSAKNNFFLVIEGLDGSGKSEMARRLSKNLRVALRDDFGKTVKLTWEPHDPSCAGLFIRQTLTHSINPKPDSMTIALAFAANRLDHCDRVIAPFIKSSESSNHVVICDRYYLSSLVYQSVDGLSIEEIMNLNRKALKPDLILFLNADDKICSDRMKKREEEKEFFEKNLRETRKKYYSAIKYLETTGELVEEVDANGNQDEVLANMIDKINLHSPEWLKLQPAFQIDYEPEVINVNGGNGITISKVAKDIFDDLMPFQMFSANDMDELLQSAEKESIRKVMEMNLDDLGYLFLDHLRTNGFVISDKFSWTDVDAFWVDMQMPLGVKQKGIAILGNEIHKELIIYKKVAYNRFEALNFILLFLPSVRQKENYFESEFLSAIDEQVFSPAVKRFYKDDIATALTSVVISYLQDEFAETLIALPVIKQVLYSFCESRKLIDIT